MQFWFQLGLFGQANVPIVQKLYKHIYKFNPILCFKRDYLSYFQKTIVWTSCLMSTQARHDGDSIVQKRNPPIQKI